MNVAPHHGRCPRCGIDLVATKLAWLSACRRCGGVFAHKTMTKLGVAEASTAREVSAAAPVRAGTAAAVMCAVCMKPTAREKLRGVEVDRCMAHGFWFDRDEIEQAIGANGPRPGAAFAAAVVGAGVVGAGAVAVAANAQRANVAQVQSTAGDVLSNVGDTAGSVLDVAGDALDVVDAADVAVGLVGGLFELLGGLFD